jgi:hypothetical protein
MEYRWRPVLTGLAATLAAACAFASGREGEQYVEVVRTAVNILVAALAITTIGGILHGGHKARQKDESLARGCATGFVKGIVAFVVLCGASLALLTIVGGVYIAYAILVTNM